MIPSILLFIVSGVGGGGKEGGGARTGIVGVVSLERNVKEQETREKIRLKNEAKE